MGLQGIAFFPGESNSMTTLFEKVEQATKTISSRTTIKPKVGIILGTGLGSLTDRISIEASLDYETISPFSHFDGTGHHGRIVLGHLGGKPVVAMEGRHHAYEGYNLCEITLPVRVMKALAVSIWWSATPAGA